MSELQAWLDKLGAMSVAEIRKLLVAEGIKGHTSAYHCPIANLLTLKCGHVVAVDGACAYSPPVLAPMWTRLPESVTKFIANFDTALYPELSDGTVSEF